MSNRRPSLPDKSAAIIARLTDDVASLKASVEWLTTVVVAGIVRQADLSDQGLLTTKQAAYAAGVRSEGTIRHWRDQGKIEVVEVGRKRYVKASSLPNLRSSQI